MTRRVKLLQFLMQVKQFTILRIWKESRCLLKKPQIHPRWLIQWVDLMGRIQQLVKWRLVSKFGRLSLYKTARSWSRLKKLRLPTERLVTHAQTSKNLVKIFMIRRILWWRNISQDFWPLLNFLKTKLAIWTHLWFFWSKLLKKVCFWIPIRRTVVKWLLICWKKL